MSGILVYSEVESTTLGLLTRGQELAAELGKSLDVALLGKEAVERTGAYQAHGANRVYTGNDPALAAFQAGT